MKTKLMNVIIGLALALPCIFVLLRSGSDNLLLQLHKQLEPILLPSQAG